MARTKKPDVILEVSVDSINDKLKNATITEKKKTRKPSAYNLKIGEFMKQVEKKDKMAKAQEMYRAWKAEQA